MDFDLVIRNGTLVTAGDTVQADLGLRQGVIAAIGQALHGPEIVDATGLLVLPGAVDAHVHLAMPTGNTVTSDDWRSGTRAAACGGTTAVLDFVEPAPEVSLMSALEARRAEADAGSVLDYGLHMTLSNAKPETLAQIPEVVAAGITSFKTYTTYAGFRLNDAALLSVMQHVQQADGLVITHCESDAIVQASTHALLDAGQISPAVYPQSRPAVAEAEAIARVLALAEVAQAPIYIVHISTARGAHALAQAKARGQRAYGETCPHYLLLTEQDYARPGFEGAKYVCAPPLRTAADAAALWHALGQHILSTLATDHCAFKYVGQKDIGKRCFTDIPGGLPGIESRLALLYTFGVGEGHISLNRWVELICTAPARIFGLYPRKGTLSPGADADIVLFDPDKHVTLSQTMLHENVDYTPYEGFELCGYPVMTFQRGQCIAKHGQFIGADAKGHYLHRNF